MNSELVVIAVIDGSSGVFIQNWTGGGTHWTADWTAETAIILFEIKPLYGWTAV